MMLPVVAVELWQSLEAFMAFRESHFVKLGTFVQEAVWCVVCVCVSLFFIVVNMFYTVTEKRG